MAKGPGEKETEKLVVGALRNPFQTSRRIPDEHKLLIGHMTIAKEYSISESSCLYLNLYLGMSGVISWP